MRAREQKLYPSRLMNPICEQAGCDFPTANKHAWKWENKRWHSHPSQDFLSWWEPFDTEQESGASLGGHPDASRIWARRDAHGWKRRRYGISAENAWNSAEFFNQFDAWRLSGRPERPEEFVSIAAPLERQREFWSSLKKLIFGSVKKFPDPLPHDYDATAERIEE